MEGKKIKYTILFINNVRYLECSLINCLFFRMFSIRAWPEIPWSEENFLPIGGARNLTKSSGLKMGLDLLQRRLVFDPYFTHINNEILSRCLHKYIGLEKRKSNENLRSSDCADQLQWSLTFDLNLT